MAASIRAFFKARPLVANCITYGSLYTGAEFLQQTLLRKVLPEKKEDYDLAQLGRYGAIGSTFLPTFMYYWYKFLDSRIVSTKPQMIVAKVLIDQGFTAPIILSTFYVAMSAMEGREDIFKECKEKFWNTLKVSCQFWMPIQCLNFAFVPNMFRVVYIGSMSFIWVNILCILKRGNSEVDTEKKE